MPSSMSATIDLNANQGPSIVALVWVEATLALMIVLLRIYARIRIKALGLDDWTILLSLVSRPLYPLL